MGKGVNARSLENLRRGNPATQFSGRNAVEMARKSAEARRRYSSFREAAHDLLTDEVMIEIIQAMIDQAKSGNIRAFEVLRDSVDGKPVQGVNLSNESNDVHFTITVVDSEGNVIEQQDGSDYFKEISG